MKIKYIVSKSEGWSYTTGDSLFGIVKIQEITYNSNQGRDYFYLILDSGDKIEICTNSTMLVYYEKEL